MLRGHNRTKFIPTPKPPRKKKHKEIEVVENCDQCGRPLAITRARTGGSLICALGDRVPCRHVIEIDELGRRDSIFYYCSEECASLAHDVTV